jgi:HK97 family phage major capsid protein
MDNEIKKEDLIKSVKEEVKAELVAEAKVIEEKKAEKEAIRAEYKKELDAETKKIEGSKGEEKKVPTIINRSNMSKADEAIMDLVKSEKGGTIESDFDIEKAEAMIVEGKKADLDGAGGYGAELPPEEMANQLYVRMAALGGGLFNKFPKATMTSNVQKLTELRAPITVQEYSTYADITKGVENATASAPGTGEATLNSRLIVGKTYVYDYLTADAKVNLIKGVKSNLAVALDNRFSNLVLNGDTTGTHMDEDSSAAGNLLLWKGLRRLAMTAGTSKDCTDAAYTLAELSDIEALMGKYAVGVNVKQALWIFGVKGIGKLKGLLAAKTGNLADAVIKDGVVTSYLGHPIVVSEYQREDLEIDGFFDVSGVAASQGFISLVNVNQFIIGLRQKLVVEVIPDPLKKRKQITGTILCDFQPLETPTTSISSVAAGFGFTA